MENLTDKMYRINPFLLLTDMPKSKGLLLWNSFLPPAAVCQEIKIEGCYIFTLMAFTLWLTAASQRCRRIMYIAG